MQPNTQEAAAYFVWQAPGKPLTVHLAFDVVERLNADVMRGLAAVPKRGAEVGGVLLGTIIPGEAPVVRVDGFEPIPCEYRRGPSFYLSDGEQEMLRGVATEERVTEAGSQRAVGYYRSHTRDGALSLGPEDLDYISRFFPDDNQVALLVRPFATKVGVAGFFVREAGVFPTETPLEFPFRRREMLGEEAPARRSMYERKPRNRERRELSFESATAEAGLDFAVDYPPYEPAYQEEIPQRPVRQQRGAWMWLPLALIFLLLGTALGYQLTVTFLPGMRANQGATAFALDLSAVQNGESISVTWNREAPAVASALRGALEIADGELSNTVQLDAARLKQGAVLYQNASPMVRFRLVVSVAGNVTVTETVEWKQ